MEQPVTLDYSANLNPLGMPAEIRQALVDHVDDFQPYPDPYCRELRQHLSTWEQVPAEWILCGNGAADLILRIARALEPKKTLLLAPTFSEYEKAVKLVGSEVVYYDLQRDRNFRVTEDFLDALTPDLDMVFLCNPNNPTGQTVPKALMDRIIDTCKARDIYPVVDECFLEFTREPSCKDRLADRPKLIILKAFTKIFSMAGLRMGYCLCADEALLGAVEAQGQSWSVSAPAQYGAMAGCQCGDFVETTRQFVETERLYMEQALENLGLTVVPGKANYIFFRGPTELWQQMADRGILIRRCANYRGLDQQDYRICVKQRPENQRFLSALQEIMNETNNNVEEVSPWQNPL